MFMCSPACRKWLTLYFSLGMASIGLQVIRALATISGSVAASRRLHAGLLHKVVRLPMSFFDSQPAGRLLNRLTKDTELVDVQVCGWKLRAAWLYNTVQPSPPSMNGFFPNSARTVDLTRRTCQ
jgi:ABC-type multidrug transport system fused ATPase/permease subunit